MKRSRFGQTGLAGSYRKYFCQSVYTTGARPIGAPGWPEFACWTASMESVRMVLTESCAIFDWLTIAPSGQGILFPVQTRCSSATYGGKVSYAKTKLGVYSAGSSVGK